MKFSFKKCRDLILGAVMLLLSGFYIYFASTIKTRPKLTPSFASARRIPYFLGILLAILSVLLILQGIKKMKEYDPAQDGQKMEKGDMFTVALTFAVIILYTVLLPRAGFCISTALFLFAQMMILAPKDKRNILLFAIVAVVFTAIAFVAFRIGLSQMLPRGPIEALIGY